MIGFKRDADFVICITCLRYPDRAQSGREMVNENLAANRVGRAAQLIINVNFSAARCRRQRQPRCSCHRQQIVSRLRTDVFAHRALQFSEHVIRRRITVFSALGRGALDDALKRCGNAALGKRGQRRAFMQGAHLRPVDHRVARARLKRRAARQHLVKNNAGGVDVYARVVAGIAPHSFGRHISRRAEALAGQRQAFAAD